MASNSKGSSTKIGRSAGTGRFVTVKDERTSTKVAATASSSRRDDPAGKVLRELRGSLGKDYRLKT